MSKLTLHFQKLTPWAKATVAAGGFAWVKLLDPTGADPFPGARTIGRLTSDAGEPASLVAKGAAGADEWWAWAEPRIVTAPWVHAWEVCHRPPVETAEQRRALVAYTQRAAELARGAGLRIAVGSFAPGAPATDPATLQELAGLFAAGDYLSLQQYGPNPLSQDAPTRALRHRTLVAALRGLKLRVAPILITEFGMDAPGGWHRACSSFAEFQEQLRWASQELDRDPEVECAAIFTSGADAEATEKGHAFGEAPAAWLAKYVQAHPTPALKGFDLLLQNAAWNAGGIPYNVDAAFPTYARAHGLGNPETPEFDLTYKGVRYRGQGFSEGIVYAVVGDWQNCQHVRW